MVAIVIYTLHVPSVNILAHMAEIKLFYPAIRDMQVMAISHQSVNVVIIVDCYWWVYRCSNDFKMWWLLCVFVMTVVVW